MSVKYELTGFLTALRHSHSVHHVIESSFKKDKKILAGYSFSTVCLDKVRFELRLLKSVVSLSLLLFTELFSVFLFLRSGAGGAMLSGSRGTMLNGAFSVKATVSLQKELGFFSATKSA